MANPVGAILSLRRHVSKCVFRVSLSINNHHYLEITCFVTIGVSFLQVLLLILCGKEVQGLSEYQIQLEYVGKNEEKLLGE